VAELDGEGVVKELEVDAVGVPLPALTLREVGHGAELNDRR
jgi:hypothetical protein